MADKPKVMAIVGSQKTSAAMRQQAAAQTKQALAAGWRISTGGAQGVDAATIKTVLNAGKAASLDIYLPQNIDNQNSHVRGLLKAAKEAGANVVEDAGMPAKTYNQACFNRNKTIVSNSDALVGLQNNKSKGTGISMADAKEKGLPVKKMSYVDGILKSISRLNAALMTIDILKTWEDYQDYKEKLQSCSELFEKWRQGKATEADIEELEKCGIQIRSELQWSDIDEDTLAPFALKHGFASVGNPYRDEQGRFCSESSAVMVIG